MLCERCLKICTEVCLELWRGVQKPSLEQLETL